MPKLHDDTYFPQHRFLYHGVHLLSPRPTYITAHLLPQLAPDLTSYLLCETWMHA